MRTDNEDFTAKNLARSQDPRYTIELSFNLNNSDLVYFTSHNDTKTPPSAVSIKNCIADNGISGTSQKIQPNKGLARIGNLTISLIDINNTISDLFNTKLDIGLGLRGKRVRVYHSFENSLWDDYVLIQTQIIDSIVYKDGIYFIRCADIQRSERKEIFDTSSTTLSRSITSTQNLVPVYSVTGFDLLEHGNSYSDAPNKTVLYIIVEKEIIRCIGTTINPTFGLSFSVDINGRGVLNTTAVAHNIDTTLTDNSRKTKVSEFVYLEMPVVKLMYAILTGDLLFQTDQRLPNKWHLNIDPSYVRVSDFQLIGKDIYNTVNDQDGVIGKFVGIKKQDGKKFIETEMDLMIGTFNPVYSSGEIGIKRMTSVLSSSGYVKHLSNDNVVNYGDLLYDMRSVQNTYQINWNYDFFTQGYTRTTLLIDSKSIAVNGEAVLTNLNFRGLDGGRHTESTMFSLFNALRDRYSSPPLKITTTCLPSLNVLEVGDIVRLQLNSVRDYNGSLKPLDRSFEVQSVSIQWLTGQVILELFGSSQKATEISDSQSLYVLNDYYYSQEGIELKAYIDTNYPGSFNIIGDVGYITGNVTLPGNDPATIYFYDNPLVIGSGVVVTVTQTIEIRVRGLWTINGTINGLGNGLAGVANDPSEFIPNSFGNVGYLGSTQPGGGLKFVFNTSAVVYHYEAKTTLGKTTSIELFSLVNNRSTNSLFGVPSSLVGSSGAGGGNVVLQNYDLPPGVSSPGGNGGNSGAGLVSVSRGVTFGVSGSIIFTGANGTQSTVIDALGFVGGAGAGGAPGCWLVLLDGATSIIPDIQNQFIAYQGDTPTYGVAWPDQSQYPRRSKFAGYGTPGASRTESAARIQFIPDDIAAIPDVTIQAVIPPTNLNLYSGDQEIIKSSDGSIVSRIKAVWNTSTDQNLGGYEIQIKKTSLENWTQATPTINFELTTAYIDQVQDGVEYDVRLRAINNIGVRSIWITVLRHRVVGKTEPPPNCDSFLVQRLTDGVRQFDGGLKANNVPIDFAGYKIRYGAGTGLNWLTMTALHTGVIPFLPYQSDKIQAGSFTAGIVAVDTTGNESEIPLQIESTIGEQKKNNALASEDPKALGFLGAKTECYVDVDTGNLEAVSTGTWDDFAAPSPPITWDDWLSWDFNFISQIIYQHTTIDLGLVATVTPVISVTANGTLTIEESNSEDNISYSPFAVVGSNIVARYIRVRATVVNSASAPNISQFFIIFDAAFVSESISDLDTSTLTGDNRIAVGDIRLPILKTYGIIKIVQIALQSVGAGWTWEVVDKNATIGARIRIYNSSGVLSDAVIDAQISGV